MRWIIVIIFSVLSLVLAALVVRHLRRRGSLSMSDVIGLLTLSVSIVIAGLAIPATPALPPETATPTITSTPTEQGAGVTAIMPPTPFPATPTETPLPPKSIAVLPTTAVPTTTATPNGVDTATLTPSPVAPTATETMASTLPPSPSPTLAPTTVTALPTPTTPPSPTSTAAVNGEVRIRVDGIGAAPQNQTNPVLRERSALLAAEVDAKRKLAEWIAGTEIEAVTIVEQGTLTTDTIRQTVKATVPASQTIAQDYDSETGTATVTLELVINETALP